MAKPKSLARARAQQSAGFAVPVGDKDNVTITVLDTAGNPYTGPLTFSVSAATSSDTATLTTDTPTALTYGEHFLKAGKAIVHVTVTFSDSTTLAVDDEVTVTGVPGSLVATHSIPVAGP